MVGVILAAGDGLRLRESTGKQSCKVLEKICGTHLIEFALNNLVKLNIEKVYVVVGKQGGLIKSAIGESYKGITVIYVPQVQQKGLINAFAQVLDFVEGEKVLLQLADEIFVDLKESCIKKVLTSDAFDFYCGITYESDPEKIKANFSVELNDDGEIKKCTEKPLTVVNDIKGTGFCVFGNNSLRILKKTYNEKENKPYDLCDFMNILTSCGKKGITFCVAQKEFNINTLTDLEAAIRFLESESAAK